MLVPEAVAVLAGLWHLEQVAEAQHPQEELWSVVTGCHCLPGPQTQISTL